MTGFEPQPIGVPAGVASGTGLRSVLGRPQFSLLVVGQTVSQLGDKLHHMALLNLIAVAAAVSTSGIELAKLASAVTLPVVLFGPIAGALVDRWNKRATMIVCDLLRTLLVATIPFIFHLSGSIWPVYVMAFVVALLGLFFNSAKMALIPVLVAHDQLFAANAALTSIGRLATVAGIVGGGLLVSWTIWERVGWTGYEAGFYLDAVSYGVSVLTLIGITLLSAAHARRAADVAGHRFVAADLVRSRMVSLASDMRQTLRLIRTHHDLRFAFATVILLGVLAASIFIIMTASVQTVMGHGTRGVGFLGGLLAGGMVVGSLLVGTIGKRWNKRHIILFGCFAMGALMILGSIRYSYVVFISVAFLGGLVLAPVMVAQDTLLHESAPAAARALIFSTRDLVLGAAFMGSALLVGSGVPALGLLGAHEPYRLALFLLGALISAAAVGGEASLLRRRTA